MTPYTELPSQKLRKLGLNHISLALRKKNEKGDDLFCLVGGMEDSPVAVKFRIGLLEIPLPLSLAKNLTQVSMDRIVKMKLSQGDEILVREIFPEWKRELQRHLGKNLEVTLKELVWIPDKMEIVIEIELPLRKLLFSFSDIEKEVIQEVHKIISNLIDRPLTRRTKREMRFYLESWIRGENPTVEMFEKKIQGEGDSLWLRLGRFYAEKLGVERVEIAVRRKFRDKGREKLQVLFRRGRWPCSRRLQLGILTRVQFHVGEAEFTMQEVEMERERIF